MAIAILLAVGVAQAKAQDLTPLRLFPSPVAGGAECEQHPGQADSARPTKGSGGKPGGKLNGRPAEKSGGKPALESEHRPQPVRTYYFNEHRRQAQIKAVVRRPDGSLIEPTLQLGVNPNLSFPTPMGEGPGHGANNVYLVEQGVEDQVLVVRTAQWITMHHNCGWGHDHKFDPARTRPQALKTIPLEIVVNDLWDTNFHARVTSGQDLTITVLNYGKPLAGAKVRVQTEKKWVKEVVTGPDGTAALQLIKDYYPGNWSDFKRIQRAEFLVTASCEAAEQGVFAEQPYQRVSYLTTLPWQYAPAPADYSSYALGLIIGLLGFTLTGGGVYFYRQRRKKPYQGISLAG
ncbi:MAG: DUF4198 domain-containing protein [Proteobacteria bacterium]|nr:DUF4198 domain-containing protein [Pseudomonadota bacterium]MBU1717299.1 DUF4198 domain-containing protein [Pseudomonadota bacterium]